MQVFYIEIDKFLKEHDKNFLANYADIEIKTEKRFYQYTIGRYLVKETAKKYYNVADTEIIINKSGKPEFKNSDLHFSISHSKNIVIACFDEYPCGIDIEYMKERDLKKLSKYFNENFKTLENFYKFWTSIEAKYKSGTNLGKTFSFYYNKEYYISISSKTNFNSDKNINCIKPF